MGRTDEYPELPLKERERIKRREKKRRPGMVVSGRSIKTTLVRIIQERAEGIRPLTSKKKRKKRRK